MTGLLGDGAGLMGTAFKGDQPTLELADLSTQTGRDVQSGYRFLFLARSGRSAIRPPTSSSANWTATRPSSCSAWPVF